MQNTKGFQQTLLTGIFIQLEQGGNYTIFVFL